MFDNIQSDVTPAGRKGREKTDLSPLLNAADTANGEWRSVVGTSSMHTYRTRIQCGDMPEAPVGAYEVKVQNEDTAAGTVGDDDYTAPTFRLFIRKADAATASRLIANAARRAQRLSDGGTDDEADEEEFAPANPLG